MVLYSSGTLLERSSSRASARSFATFFSCRFFCLMPNASAVERIFCSPRIGISSFPSAAYFKASITSLACMPCWAAPAAAERRRFLATIRSASAPQTPLGDFGVIRHGPMLHILQQIPANPKLHCGFCWSNLSKHVSIPSCSILRIISLTAGSGVCSITSCLEGNVFLYSLTAFI